MAAFFAVHARTFLPAVPLPVFASPYRTGPIYLTVWGPESPASVEIEIDAAKLGLKEKPSFSEMVSDTPMQAAQSPKGWKLNVPMEQDMTRVIRIR